jgi:hypothetical protein
VHVHHPPSDFAVLVAGTAAAGFGIVGVGLDRTNGNDCVSNGRTGSGSGAITVQLPCAARYVGVVALGYHYFQQVEYSESTTVTYASSDSSDPRYVSGLSGVWPC